MFHEKKYVNKKFIIPMESIDSTELYVALPMLERKNLVRIKIGGKLKLIINDVTWLVSSLSEISLRLRLQPKKSSWERPHIWKRINNNNLKDPTTPINNNVSWKEIDIIYIIHKVGTRWGIVYLLFAATSHLISISYFYVKSLILFIT